MKTSFARTAALAALASAAGAGAANAQSAAPPPPTVATAWAGAPRTTEEDRQFKVNGRVQYDVYDVSSDFPGVANDQSYLRSAVRRAFIGVEGRFTTRWRYNIKFDLAPGQSDTSNQGNEVRFDDAFLEYAGDDYSIFIGQNNQVSPMEDRDSSNYIPFNERSAIIQAAGFGKIFGFDFVMNGGNWSAGIGWHGDTSNNGETASADEQMFVIGRATWAPIYQRTPEGLTLVHLGISARDRDSDRPRTGAPTLFGYSVRPPVGFGTSFINTGANFEHDRWIGAEFAAQYNAFGVEAEWGRLEGQLSGAGERSFDGGYVDLFWSPTGESRNYQAVDGSFGRTAPRRTLGSDGGIGHIMLSARYDTINLTDLPTDGGAQTSTTLGITWMPISYVKFQLNASHSDIELPTSAAEGDADAFTFRTQIDW